MNHPLPRLSPIFGSPRMVPLYEPFPAVSPKRRTIGSFVISFLGVRWGTDEVFEQHERQEVAKSQGKIEQLTVT